MEEKNKGGRPRKEKKGKAVFIPADLIEIVEAMLNAFRKQQQAKQATQ